MCHIFFIHSSVDGHLGCFHVLAIVNRAAMNVLVHDSFWIMVFSGYMPSSGIARLYGSSRQIHFWLILEGRSKHHNSVCHESCSSCLFWSCMFLNTILQGWCCLEPCCSRLQVIQYETMWAGGGGPTQAVTGSYWVYVTLRKIVFPIWRIWFLYMLQQMKFLTLQFGAVVGGIWVMHGSR